MIQLSLDVGRQHGAQNTSNSFGMLGELTGTAHVSKLTNSSTDELSAPLESGFRGQIPTSLSKGILHIIDSFHEPVRRLENNEILNAGSLYCTVTWMIVGSITFAMLACYFEWKERRRIRRREPISDPPTCLPLESWVVIFSMDILSVVSLDNYFSLMPGMMAELGAPAYLVSYTLCVNFVAKAIGQIIMGLLAERWGRQPVFFLGSALYSVCALGCSSAPSVTWLLLLRACQGFGEASGDISVAVIRDILAPSERFRMNSTRWFVRFLVPAAVCSLGGPIVSRLGWRNFMVVLAAWGCFNNVAVAWILPETRPLPKTVSASAGVSLKSSMLNAYGLLSSPLTAGSLILQAMIFALVYSTLIMTTLIFESYWRVQPDVVVALQTAFPVITLAFPVLMVGQLAKDSLPINSLRFGMSVQSVSLCVVFFFGFGSSGLAGVKLQAVVLSLIWLMMTAVGLVAVPLEMIFLEEIGHMAALASGIQAMLKTVLGAGLILAFVRVTEVYHEQGAFIFWGALMICCQAIFWGIILRWYVQPPDRKKQGTAFLEDTLRDTVDEGEDCKPTSRAPSFKDVKH
eukprot:CAMPEP_0115461986 /NCGR_PEP_ID=MMETSP0271-20121206/47586_1 /TAXON_ID=71861 /ORGANISM="Scrippsiella trochoidea, Strain CCMP3099" /LENGTH=572 /DNA_ID=CAMNT_0002888749 /DNA_START=183 /DNA_END=1901 /DNA_ORIENTATION=+